ncbi:1-acyl-sn-glycerol-3-phosphate acyltransferase [Brumimicrobium mesophilum]|uniref:1-acyl-sn-glycerol-3-phosphate acyltransferase n=1 Tax=Brumimicrobium mesophilum TaxID=392717 RepID=UPI000D140675|nr:1-acyl-sn-glycerol-3-phosphate acyltransferase [Brumimicrobium mesophilum]
MIYLRITQFHNSIGTYSPNIIFMITLISKIYWKIYGWKIVGSIPPKINKMILVIAPHTSWIDILIGFAARPKLGIKDAKFMGKKELFEGPFGKILKNMGGIPVDRKAKLGVVDQIAKYYNENNRLIIGVSPEGTRKRVNKLKTGFYHIAKTANIPIVLIGFDYKSRVVLVGDLIYTSDNEVLDIEKIIEFFSTIQGANPEFDLRHLKKNLRSSKNGSDE